MKTFGIISKMDETGGIKLPDVFLGLCEVGTGDNLEMSLVGNNVVMKKYPPACVFCGSTKDLQEYREKNYCSCCADELRNY